MLKAFNSKLSSLLIFADALPCRRILFEKWVVFLALVIGILIPCPQECFALEAKKPTEFVNSSLVGGESRIENREWTSVRVTQGGQCVSESGAKNGGCIRETFQPKQINAAKDGNQGRNDSKGPSRDIADKIGEIIQAFLLGLIVAAPPIVLVLSSTKKP